MYVPILFDALIFVVYYVYDVYVFSLHFFLSKRASVLVLLYQYHRPLFQKEKCKQKHKKKLGVPLAKRATRRRGGPGNYLCEDAG